MARLRYLCCLPLVQHTHQKGFGPAGAASFMTVAALVPSQTIACQGQHFVPYSRWTRADWSMLAAGVFRHRAVPEQHHLRPHPLSLSANNPLPSPSPIAGVLLPIQRAEELLGTLPGVISARIVAGP